MAGLIWLVIIGTSIWVLVDAKTIGVRKGLVSGMGNMGPWGWFFACLLLWIIGFPFYLAKRGDFKKAASLARQQPQGKARPVTNDSLSQLEKLAQLKEKGVLTEDEFAKKKREILG